MTEQTPAEGVGIVPPQVSGTPGGQGAERLRRVKQGIREAAEQVRDDVVDLSHAVHADPEIAFEETRTAAKLTTVLERHGFSVETGVANLDTAFVASYGTGPFVVGICAEMDALPGVGHACGHNIIAASGVLAGISLAPVADELDLTVKVFGTPAEEYGGGKVLMLNQGVFDGVHAAMMLHPGRGGERGPRDASCRGPGDRVHGQARPLRRGATPGRQRGGRRHRGAGGHRAAAPAPAAR
ncbi:hypothetical protein GCM10009859_20760 [Kocuria salsicia]